MISTPVIVKTAIPIIPMLKGLGSKAMPWAKTLGHKVVGAFLKSPPATIGHVGWMAKPHLAMPAFGAGIGAVGNIRSQGKKIQQGEQAKFDLKGIGTSAAIGAGMGLGASFVKPVNNAWKKGFTTRGLTPGSTAFTRKESNKFLAENPTWARQRLGAVDRSAPRRLLHPDRMTRRWSEPQRVLPKFLSKGYFQDIAQDFRHPIESIKALGRDVTHTRKTLSDGSVQIMRRSPIGTLAAAGFNVGLPASFAVGTLKDKDASPVEKAIRLGAIGASYATPKAIPSMLLYSSPDAIYRKKKPTPQLPEGHLYEQPS